MRTSKTSALATWALLGALAATTAGPIGEPAAYAMTPVEEAKAHYDKGLTAYALGKYVDAAAEYEKAFEAKPEGALLYNAAQAHRLAGNKERARLLYTNYLRIYGAKVPNRREVQHHIDELTAAIENEGRLRNAPPYNVAPVEEPKFPAPTAATPAPTPVAPSPAPVEPVRPATPVAVTHVAAPVSRPDAPPPEAVTAPVASPSSSSETASPGTASSETASSDRPLIKKPWFWGAIAGGVVVLGAGIGLGVGLGSSPAVPSPTFGVASVQ